MSYFEKQFGNEGKVEIKKPSKGKLVKRPSVFVLKIRIILVNYVTPVTMT